ncbi:MAG: acyl-CoA desaturase [Flavobacteriales bacterium]|nr:acyl-CoA desaturase [Flavobacteriales bacterium]
MAETIELENRGKVSISPGGVIFFVIHLIPLTVFIPGFMAETGVTTFDWVMCVFLYFFRMYFVTGVYHRYFAHRTYKTSRWFQFVLAFFAQTTIQKGVLWWAANHRMHHKTSDTPADPHSMKLYGFWYSHIGWFLGPDYNETLYDKIKDYAKYPELIWLNKFHWIPPLIMGTFMFFLGAKVNGGSWTEVGSGVSTLMIGFFLSTAILFHGTYTINSLTHYFGKARYKTGDESKNNFILALITMGEGWHNNHHYYPASMRNGFFWWEIDITFYITKMLSFVGLVWDIQGVPSHIKNSVDLKDAMELRRIDIEKKKAA